MTDQPTAPQTWDTLPDDPADIPFPIVVGWKRGAAKIENYDSLDAWSVINGTPAWWMPWPTFAPDPMTVNGRHRSRRSRTGGGVMEPTPENLRESADDLAARYHVVTSASSPAVDIMRAAADRIEELEAALEREVARREEAEEWADELAAAISRHTDEPIGEHSNTNNPWARSLELLGGAE